MASKSLPDRFAHLVGSEEGADFWFDIELDEERIPAHKIFVASGSDVLRRIIYGADGCIRQEISSTKVDDITSAGFRQILRYLYTDQVELNHDNVIEILKKANYYDITILEKRCNDYVIRDLTTDNCLLIFTELNMYMSFQSIIEKCLRLIGLNPHRAAFDQSDWVLLDPNSLQMVLSSDIINCDEFELFEALLKWANAQCVFNEIGQSSKELRTMCNGLENFIRWSTLSLDELDRVLALQPGFFDQTEVDIIRTHILQGTGGVTKRQRCYTENAIWVPHSTNNPSLPPGAVYVGRSFRSTYVARSFSNGRMKPTVYIPSFHLARLLENTDTHLDSFEVLCGAGYEWVPLTETVQDNLVAIDVNRDYIALVARSSEEMCTVHMNLRNGKMSTKVGIDLKDIEILVSRSMLPACPPDTIPADAICIGTYGPNLRSAYLGRAYIGSDVLPAIIYPDTRMAYAPWDCSEHSSSEYEFLRLPPESINWVPSRNGEIVVRAVEGGRTELGEKLYFGRAMYKKKMVYGKIHPSHNRMYFGMNGKELNKTEYEVLVHQDV